MKKVLVTGADGQLGKCLQNIVEKNPLSGFEFLFFNKEQFNLEKPSVIESFFFSNKIDFLVNCGAYTQVDLAEKEVERAFKINADAVGLLASECAQQNTTFIHISTDYVYNGMADSPYSEEDLTQPLGVYGKSKLEGERLAMENNPDSIIIRTSWLYSRYRKNFLTTMLQVFKEKEELNIVADQRGTPTCAADLAKAIVKVIESPKKTSGIFHFSNAGETTWFGFAEAIKEITKSDIKLNPIASSEYPTLAKRPSYSVLDCEKIEQTYLVERSDWRIALNNCLD